MQTLPKKLVQWLTAAGFTKVSPTNIFQWSSDGHQKPIYMLQHTGADLMIIRTNHTRSTQKDGVRWITTVSLAMPTQAIIDLLAALTAHETRL